jgi:hypothetical protein
VVGDESFFFPLMKRLKFGAVDGRHGDKGKIAGMRRIGKRRAREKAKSFYTRGTERTQKKPRISVGRE